MLVGRGPFLWFVCLLSTAVLGLFLAAGFAAARHWRDTADHAWTLTFLAEGAAFYVVATATGLLKPNQRVTAVAYLAGLAGAVECLHLALDPVSNAMSAWETALYHFIQAEYPVHFALAYHFAVLFPSGTAPGRLWSALVWAGYGGFIAVWPLSDNHPASRAYVALASAAICAALHANYRRVADADQRRRIKWAAYGIATGLLPTALIIAAQAATGMPLRLWERLAYAATLLVPVSFGYAVLKHRVLGIQVVVRRGVQYLLARRALQAILALPLAALVFAVASNPNRTVGDLIGQGYGPLGVAAAAALSLRYRRQLTLWLDRRFFREAYEEERILRELIERVKEAESVAAVSDMVTRRIEAALHPARVFVFAKAEGGSEFRVTSTSAAQPWVNLPADNGLVRQLEAARSAVVIEEAAEKSWLERLEVELIVPVIGTDARLSGLLMLGAKKSEEPYTAPDRALLRAIADQMAVVFEVFWLKERVEREGRIRRDVLARLPGAGIELLKECPACGICYDSTAQTCAADGRELTCSLPVERVLEGKYRLERLLGKGGMGAVYAAADLRLNRDVAVKLMMGSLFGNQTALRRFAREAQAAARLNHPNVATIFDYGAVGGDGAYLVMELIRGRSWRVELEERGALDGATAARWFEGLLEGVKAAHRAGIVHRDLKPENVLIAGETVKVLDFGLARIRTAGNGHTVTVAGGPMGTLGYMAPEQLTGGAADERADIFAVGVMVAEALTGRRPFEEEDYLELLAAMQRPVELAGASRDLSEIVTRCLAPDPAARFGSADELSRRLIPAIRECPPLLARLGKAAVDTLSPGG